MDSKLKAKTLGLIPARAGSKRLPKKNTLPINNVPMAILAYNIMRSSNVDRTLLVTDIEEFKGKIPDKDIQWRPAHISADGVTLQQTIKWVLENPFYNLDFDKLVILLPNCPGITKEDINKALKLLDENNLNIVRSYNWTSGIENGLIVARTRFYFSHIVDTYCGCILTNNIEIHTEEDYKIARRLLEK